MSVWMYVVGGGCCRQERRWEVRGHQVMLKTKGGGKRAKTGSEEKRAVHVTPVFVSQL